MSSTLDALPIGWELVSLKDVLLNIIGGGTPSKKVYSYYQGDIPWFSVKDMKTLRPSDSLQHITQNAIEESATNLIPANTVVIATRIAVGKAIKPTVDFTINQDLKALILPKGINSDFILYWINSNENKIYELGSGTTVKGITLETLNNIEFLLPPENEQNRIVEKLEELLSDLDGGIAELKTAQAKLTQYRQSLLKSAVEGTLTQEWREVNAHKITETGEQLLARILKEHRSRWEQQKLEEFAGKKQTPPKDWQKKYPEPVKPDTSDLPELPEGWVWASIDQCVVEAKSITDGPFGSNLKSSHYVSKGPRVIRLQNIGDGVFYDEKAYITYDHFQTLLKHSIESDDVVVAMMGEVLPRSCIIPDGVAPGIVKADCARVRVNKDVLSSYLLASFLNSPATRQRTKSLIKGIGRPRINLGHIRELAIPIASLGEQQAIVDSLNSQFDETNNKILELDVSLMKIDAQRKNILKDAFSGKLVHQNPSDESASVLLEKIKAERMEKARQSKPKQTKKKPITRPA